MVEYSIYTTPVDQQRRMLDRWHISSAGQVFAPVLTLAETTPQRWQRLQAPFHYELWLEAVELPICEYHPHAYRDDEAAPAMGFVPLMLLISCGPNNEIAGRPATAEE